MRKGAAARELARTTSARFIITEAKVSFSRRCGWRNSQTRNRRSRKILRSGMRMLKEDGGRGKFTLSVREARIRSLCVFSMATTTIIKQAPYSGDCEERVFVLAATSEGSCAHGRGPVTPTCLGIAMGSTVGYWYVFHFSWV